MYYLKLKPGIRSYRGKVFASAESPEHQTEDKALAKELLATGYFNLIEYQSAPSLFTRDPDLTGGVNCHVKLHQFSADVSGVIAWYDTDEEQGRIEGCRVGFLIKAPEDFAEADNIKYELEDQDSVVIYDEFLNPGCLYWYPFVEAGVEERSITVDWDPDGERPEETFTVFFKDYQLQPKPQTEEEKLAVLLDSMTIAELKKYAEEEKIDLGNLTKKSEIVEAIMKAKFPPA